jgi:hypothetical protein
MRVGADFDAGAVKGHMPNLYMNDLFFLQNNENPLQNPLFCPSVRLSVY